MILNNLHLIMSSIIVSFAAIIYGFRPDLLFDVQVNSVDEHSIFKAIMGLYLAFAVFWINGIFNIEYWTCATISNIIFMLGMGLGRIVSILFDGITSSIFMFGTIGELVLGFYGIYVLNKNSGLSKN